MRVEAGSVLWLRVPGVDDALMLRLLVRRGLVTMPGFYLGNGGEGYLRVALTPAGERIARAAELLASVKEQPRASGRVR